MAKRETMRRTLQKYANARRKETNEWFFKMGEGQYGAHDRFLGVTNPDVRKVAQIYRDASLIMLQKTIAADYNEERLCTLIILGEQYRKGDEQYKRQIYSFYKKNLRYVNNWNLVDLSAPYIMGDYLVTHNKEKRILKKLVVSPNLWRRRIAIIASWAYIKEGDICVTLNLAQELLHDKEDLIHKAVGWMLREVGKRDQKILEKFLDRNIKDMARTTLRYAIERFPEKKRQYYLQKT